MSTHTGRAEPSLFAESSEAGVLMRAIDWSQTAIGSVDTWSPALRMMVPLLLANRFQLILWWGPEFCQLYNDAYRPILGTKHPRAMGQLGRECWPEIWHIIGPLIERPFHGGEATWIEDLLLEVNRFGFTEETHFTIAYSPVPDNTVPSGIGGVLGTIHEITEKVIGERRVVVLRDLGARSAEAKTVDEACAIAAETLAQHPEDVPFALIYVLDENRLHAHLAGAAGVGMGEAASPVVIKLEAPTSPAQPWPLAEAVRTATLQLVEDLPGKLGRAAIPPGPWSDPPHTAVIVPIRSNRAHQLAGLLVLGVSARLQFDDQYRGFCELVASQVATALANAHAYEDERKRAQALEEIDRAKTVFFSNVSHEFRTPLTLMLGPLEELLTQKNNILMAERAELELVHRNGLRLLKLVNTLLDFARIEAGRVQAVYEPTDLAAFTADLASVYRSACERAGLRLVVDCPPLPTPVYVDRDMWEKIVLNLLSNAFKFTLAGTITVRLVVEERQINLIVSDTGVGIPAADLPHLFERFYRGQEHKSRTHEGSGIGLALVRELAKLHGGTVQAESREGHGSVFTVTILRGTAHLPAERIGTARTITSTATSADAYVEEALRWLPEEAEASPRDQVANRTAGARPSAPLAVSLPISASIPQHFGHRSQDTGARARVLLADDNADMREYLMRLLSTQYEVDAVADGETALAHAHQRPPDLVLTDVMMPGLNGIELLRALRTDPSLHTIPILLLSARAGEEARIEGLAAGADDYLVKPFGARELLARVGAHLEIARLRQEAMRREQALREEADAVRQRVTIVLESISDAFFTVDRQWRITYANPRAKKLWGRPHDDFIGKNLWEEFPESQQMGFGDQMRQAMVEHVTGEYEGYYPPLEKWFVLRAYPSSEGVAVYFQDITARKEAEVAVRESEAKFATAFQLNPLPMALITSDGRVVEANTAVEQSLGYTRAELLGRTTAELGLYHDPQRREDFYRLLQHESRVRELEAVWITKGGAYRTMLMSAEPLMLHNQRYLLVVNHDITDRKLAEETLRREQELLQTLIDTVPVLITLYEPDTKVLRLNREFERVTGWSAETAAGLSLMEACYPDPTEREQIREFMESCRPGWMDMRLHTRTGRVVETSWANVRLTSGVQVGIGVDITDRKRAEEERERLLAEFQQFSYIVSHDLNEPLRTMQNYVQLLAHQLHGTLDASATEAMTFVTDAARRMQQMLTDLLAYTRAGQPPEFQTVDCEALLAQALSALQTQIEERRAIITHDPLPTVRGDATRLRQVLQNLLSNALKFCAEQPRIHLSAVKETYHWRFAVRDNGIGIEPQQVDKLFQVFQRAHGKKYAGTGIGLAICKRIIEQHGGRIWMESRPGEGSILYFTISDI